jgi:heat shock protein HslJ
MYEIDNPDVGLVQTVSMTGEQGAIYVISLFVETTLKDDILPVVLENFAIESNVSAEVVEQGEAIDEEQSSRDVSMALVDASWSLSEKDDGSGEMVAALPGAGVTAVFAADGRMSGSAGCNNYATLYTVDGDTLTISAAAKTRKECAEPAGIMEQEQEFLTGLTNVAKFQINGDELQLLDEGDKLLMVFSSS